MPVSLRRPIIVFAALAALVAGLVSALVPAQSARAATATSAVLRAPGTLTGGHRMVSANGNFELLMGRNGDLLLYNRWGQVMWSTRTAGHHGAHLSLQADGNLVVRARSGAALWATKTRGTHAVLELRASGVLELVAHRHALWYTHTAVRSGSRDNPAPRSLLASGASLTAGHKLVSANGAAAAVMGTGGQLTDRGPDGVVWTTNSSGWRGARFTLAGNGNLLLYAADGSALWQSRTRARGAVLMLANNGNLILYDVHGHAVWQSRKAAEPQLAPDATTSHYVRDITGAATDAATMSDLGKADAVADGPAKRLVVLHIGAQASDRGDGTQWGVKLSNTSTTLTDAQLVTALEGYLSGYGADLPSGATATVAVVTNNDSRQYYDSGSAGCPVPPPGTDDPLGTAGGAEWAKVVNQLATYARSWPGITVAGGNDIEANFAGCVDQATAWTQAFLDAAPSQPYVFTGTAWGCPTTLGRTGADCDAHGDYGWTQEALYQLAYGLAPSQSIPLPQIYVGAQATQWADISATGGTPIVFGGVLTSVAACAPAGSGCSSMSPSTAWNTLSDRLSRSAATRIAPMPYATDLRVN